MQRLFVDINVILDVALERNPHFYDSQRVLIKIAKKKARGFCSVMTCLTLYYLISSQANHKRAIDFIENILKLFTIVEINKKTLERALQVHSTDYEDSVQIVCAGVCRADYIITRNVKDFKNTSIAALTPEEYLSL